MSLRTALSGFRAWIALGHSAHRQKGLSSPCEEVKERLESAPVKGKPGLKPVKITPKALVGSEN